MEQTDPDVCVDHINNNPFDNRKENLRLSNTILNGQNKSKMKNSTSKYHGVRQAGSRWAAYIATQVVTREDDEVIAARKRDLYIMHYMPHSHYKLNFVWADCDAEEWKAKLEYLIDV
jgi:hypothetical protein